MSQNRRWRQTFRLWGDTLFSCCAGCRSPACEEAKRSWNLATGSWKRHASPCLRFLGSELEGVLWAPWEIGWGWDWLLTWEAVVPAALHVQSRKVQPNPHDLHKQSFPDLIHHNLVLPIELGRGSHEASEDGVNAT